jgi:hypothetical protein
MPIVLLVQFSQEQAAGTEAHHQYPHECKGQALFQRLVPRPSASSVLRRSGATCNELLPVTATRKWSKHSMLSCQKCVL